MSWLFSQALVAEYSQANCSDGEPCAQLNVMPTPQPFCRNDKTMEPLSLSRFGLTCALLTESRGAELLTWFLAGFRAKTSALPDQAKGLAESVQGFGSRCLGLFAKFDHDLCLWRTPQRSFLADLELYSETWPRWGLMLNGECWEQTTWEHVTNVTASGLLPTPTVHGNNNAPKQGTKRGTGLATAVRMFPTATATAHKGWSKNHNRADTDDRIDYTIEREAALNGQTGRLNPTWVEWLMGWPLGWTELKPLAMGKYHNAPLKLSGF
jgi:hypothetical protein